jgi:RHS repeat-associated protein
MRGWWWRFKCYDGNGNVAALVNAPNGTESARYDYGPFAEPLRMTGTMAKLNPIRFSTQYADDVSGDVKYLHRDYTVEIGRWLSRDPIANVRKNVRDLNLYLACRNNPVGVYDLLGQDIYVSEHTVSGDSPVWNFPGGADAAGV